MPNNDVIDRLAIEFEAEITAALDASGKLVGALQQVEAAVTKLSSVRIQLGITKRTIQQIVDFSNAVNQVDVGKITAFASALSGFQPVNLGITANTGANIRAFANAIQGIDLTRLQQFGAVNASFTSLSTGITRSTVQNLIGFANAIKQIDIPALQRLAAIDFSNLRVLADASKALSKISAKAAAGQKQLAKAVRETGKSASKSTSFFGKFFQSIKRIAFYRAIRTAMRAITQGFSEGLENLYRWSQMVGTTFAPSMDRLATATLYLKNGFASMFAPLIERAVPIIDALVDKLVEFFNFAQEGFARLTGAATWSKAIKYPTTWKEAVDDATGSVKELKGQLQDFDELNVIETPTASARGRKGDELDYSAMFEKVQTDLDDTRSVGERLADALAKVFEVPEKFGNVGTKIADNIFKPLNEIVKFLERGVQNGLFKNIGKSVTEFVKNFATTLAVRIKEFKWTNAIKALTNAITGIIDGIDLRAILKAIAKLIVSIVSQIPAMIVASLASTMGLTASILRMIGEAIGADTKVGGMFISWADGIDKGAEKVYDFADRLEFLGDVAADITFNALDGKGFTLSAKQAQVYRKELKELGVEGGKANEIINGLDKSIRGFGQKNGVVSKEAESEAFRSKIHGSSASFDDYTEPKTFVQKATEFFEAHPIPVFMTIASFIDKVETKRKEAVKWVKDKALEIWFKVTNPIPYIQEKWDETVKFFKDLFLTIGFIVDDLKTLAKEKWDAVIDWWGVKKLEIGQKIDDFVQPARDKWDAVVRWWGEKKLGIKTWVEEAVSKASEKWRELTKWWGEKKLNISENVESIIPKALEKWNKFTKWWNDRKINIGLKVDSITDAVWEKWKKFQDWWAGVFVNLKFKMPHLGLQAGYSLNPVDWVKDRNTIPKLSVAWYASGGFPSPDVGSLFWAGEGGVPEMLGTIGGQTAVAGGAEITGIREAIIEQGAAERQMLAQLISAVANKDLTLVANSGTGRWVHQALKAYSGVSG